LAILECETPSLAALEALANRIRST
jgi:hypothetical protein